MKKKIILLITIAMCVSMFGCAKFATPSQVATNYMETQKTKIQDYLVEYINTEEVDMEELLSENKELVEKIYTMLVSFEYTIEGETIEEDLARVDITVKTYDFGELLTNFISEYFIRALGMAFSGATEEMTAEMINMLETRIAETENEGKTFTSSVTLELNKTDEGWVVDENSAKEAVVNVITGNLISTLSGLQDIFS